MELVADVINRIDALADEETCWHCGRQWHQQPLTQKVDRMFKSASIDPNYFAYEDTSPIVCDGSRFIGPLRPEPVAGSYTYLGSTSTWNVKLWTGNWDAIPAAGGPVYGTFTFQPKWPSSYSYSYVLGVDQAPWMDTWSLNSWFSEPEPVCDGPLPEVDVKFGPENWSIVNESVEVPASAKVSVMKRWHEFTKRDIPTPTAPGYDLKPLAEKFNKQFTHYKEKKHEGIRAPRSC